VKLLSLTFLLVSSASALPDSLHIKTAAAAYSAGSVSLKAGQNEQAIAQFKKAIDIEPTFTDAYYGVAQAYVASGGRLEAGAALTRLLEIDPERLAARVLLGQILLEQKQNQRALAQFSLVLQRDSFHADALLGFASAAHALGMDDRASAALEKGRKRYPGDTRFRPQKSAQPETVK
jgi:tetratricopeptide (TPR) repeat protein